MTKDVKETKDILRAAWDDMLQSLAEARDAIDDPALLPPPASDRNLAEGYRYLMGYVHSAVERAFHQDPLRPHFRNALSIITRSTIDNADAIYFYTPIDGRQSYRLRGHAADTGHWRGATARSAGPKAPHYVIFEATCGDLPGDTGSLAELRPGVKIQTGRLDSSRIAVEQDGSFEVLLAPHKPAGYQGNFIATRRRAPAASAADGPEAPERFANYLSGRQLFNDWEREQAIHFDMVPLQTPEAAVPPYAPTAAAGELRRCGEIVRNQMHFWNAFWTILMGTYGAKEGSIAGIAFPRNAFNKVNAAAGATGGGQSTNLYAGGVFELTADEALIVENRVRQAPQYMGFQVGNLWGESIEYGHQIGSLNGHQMVADNDGVVRLVLAHQDPGVANWIDTSGHPEGFMTARWAYSETPAPEHWPLVTATKVPFNALRNALPAGTAKVTAAQRQEQLRIRQQHVRRRYRVF